MIKKVSRSLTIVVFAASTALAQTTTLVPPTLNTSSCIVGSAGYDACLQAAQNTFQTEMNNYNTQLQEQQRLQQQAQAEMSATEAARKAQLDNEKARESHQKLQTITQLTSLAFMAAYAASCAGGATCQQKLLYAGLAFQAFAIASGMQKSNHNNTAGNACDLINKLSATQSSSCPRPTTFNPPTYPAAAQNDLVPSVIDTNGNCTASAALCDEIRNGLPPGTSLRDAANGLSAFASGKIPIKVNPDGSVTDSKSGKTVGINDLNEAGLNSLGITGANAASLLGQLKKAGDFDSDLNAKNAKNSGNGNLDGGSAFDVLAGAGNGGVGGAGAGNGDASALSDADSAAKRGLAAAEGLVKDFNGELIGVAGDDIWKMMNRRYRLKDSQDTFLQNAKP